MHAKDEYKSTLSRKANKLLGYLGTYRMTVIEVLPSNHERLISDADTPNVSVTHQVSPAPGRNHSTPNYNRSVVGEIRVQGRSCDYGIEL